MIFALAAMEENGQGGPVVSWLEVKVDERGMGAGVPTWQDIANAFWRHIQAQQ